MDEDNENQRNLQNHLDAEPEQAGSSLAPIAQIALHGCTPLNLEVETTDSLSPVAGHICIEYRGCFLCWGGYCYDERDINYRDCNWLYILPYMLLGARNTVWLKVQCETDMNLRPNSGATAGIYRDQLYIFGGCIFDDNHRRMINTSMLLAIDLRTGRLIRKRYPRGSRIPTPRDKTTSWIANDKFYIFGGYGMSWHRLDHSQHQYFFRPHYFLDDDMGSCWNNQLLFYDLKQECWNEVEQGGVKPSARAASACAYVAELDKVFLFGGRHDQTRLNDLFVLDLIDMVWTQIDCATSSPEPSPGLPPLRPEGRSWCSFTLLNNQRKILCFGGLDPAGRPLSDLWELDIGEYFAVVKHLPKSARREAQKNPILRHITHRWRQIPPLDHMLPPRLWHCAVLLGAEAILFYGGMNEAPSRDSPFVRTLLTRRLCPPTLRQIALNSLATLVVQRWAQELGARKMVGNPDSAVPSLGRRMNSDSGSDLLSFASRDFFRRFPQSLHAHLRFLLTIRKHAKALRLANTGGGGNTPSPRANSPLFNWQQPVPLQFHLLHLIDPSRIAADNSGDTNNNLLEEGNGDGPPPLRLHRPIPLSPKSQRRALADDLVAQICMLARPRRLPFLRALFDATDCVTS